MITIDSRIIVLMMSFILFSDFVSGFFVEEWREGRPRGRGVVLPQGRLGWGLDRYYERDIPTYTNALYLSSFRSFA